MLKIGHYEDIVKYNSIPEEVKAVIRDTVVILDSCYGEDRDLDGDLGGYVLVIESIEDIKSLEDIYIDIDSVIPEFVELIKVDGVESYTNSLIILSSDFAISIVSPLGITPQILLNYLD